jgi:hypothetical protein
MVDDKQTTLRAGLPADAPADGAPVSLQEMVDDRDRRATGETLARARGL